MWTFFVKMSPFVLKESYSFHVSWQELTDLATGRGSSISSKRFQIVFAIIISDLSSLTRNPSNILSDGEKNWNIHLEGLIRFLSESKWHWYIVWSSPLGCHLHLSSELERLLIHNWMNRPSLSPSLPLTHHPGFIYPKLSIKVIKKTSLKCQCAIIKLINSAHILCQSRQMMEGQVFVARGRQAFKRTVITNWKVWRLFFFFCCDLNGGKW